MTPAKYRELSLMFFCKISLFSVKLGSRIFQNKQFYTPEYVRLTALFSVGHNHSFEAIIFPAVMASCSDSITIVYYRRQRAYNPESTPYQYVTNSLTVTAAHAEFLIKNTQNNVCKYCIQGQRQVCYMLDITIGLPAAGL